MKKTIFSYSVIVINWSIKIFILLMFLFISSVIISEVRPHSFITYNYLDNTIETETIYSPKKIRSSKEGTSWYLKENEEYILLENIDLNQNYHVYQRYNVKLKYITEEKEFIFSSNEITKESVYSYATVNLSLNDFYFKEDYSNLYIDYQNNLFYSEIKKYETANNNNNSQKPDDSIGSGEENKNDITIEDDQRTEEPEKPKEDITKPEIPKQEEDFTLAMSIIDNFSSSLKMNFKLNKIPENYNFSLKEGSIEYKLNNEKTTIQDMITLQKGEYIVNYIINVSVPLSGYFKLNYSGSNFNSNISLTSNQSATIKVVLSKNNKVLETRNISCIVKLELTGTYTGTSESLNGTFDNKIIFYKNNGSKEKVLEYAEKYYPKSLAGDIGTQSYLKSTFTTKTCFAMELSNVFGNKVVGYYSSDIYSGTCVQDMTAKINLRKKIESFSLSYEKK